MFMIFYVVFYCFWFYLKLHALVEYETTEIAERAVCFLRRTLRIKILPLLHSHPESVDNIIWKDYFQVDKLNDERNWRKGFRVRLLIRRSVCD